MALLVVPVLQDTEVLLPMALTEVVPVAEALLLPTVVPTAELSLTEVVDVDAPVESPLAALTLLECNIFNAFRLKLVMIATPSTLLLLSNPLMVTTTTLTPPTPPMTPTPGLTLRGVRPTTMMVMQILPATHSLAPKSLLTTTCKTPLLLRKRNMITQYDHYATLSGVKRSDRT
jgi:hypothetical protein